MTHQDGPPDRRLSTAAFVTLTTRGIVLPTAGDVAERRLGSSEVDHLARIARGDESAFDDAAAELVEHLTRRGWLLAEPPPAVPTSARRRIAPDGPAWTPSTTAAPDSELVAPTPLTLKVTATGYAVWHPDATMACTIDARMLVALGVFRRHLTVDLAFEQQRRALGDDAFDEEDFRDRVRFLVGTGILVAYERGRAGHDGVLETDDHVAHDQLRRAEEITRRLEFTLHTPGAGRSDRMEAGRKVPVVPVLTPAVYPNLALGLILATAAEHDGGALQELYDLGPHWGLRRRRVRQLIEERGAGVFLASDYVWSSDENLEVTRLVKELSPHSVVVHGGPNVPRQPQDAEAFLREHPHIDIIAHNEGELTTVGILQALGGRLHGTLPSAELAAVPGITFRDGNGVVRTGDRERLTDLDDLPSPYLNGFFDEYTQAGYATIETDRGCPYGCTFCDWGSATLSRIRNFSLERVFAEIEWIAQHEISELLIADANFGIHQRDVEITEHIARMKDRYGFPQEVRTNFAKNTNKHLEKIIRILIDAGIATEAVLSLQTSDSVTLKAIRRSNIKTEKYDELAATFRRERLPMATELMMGLPGSTVASLDQDLQRCIDHEMPARVYRTELLVNSPMNAPEYRDEYDIAVEIGDDHPVGQSGRKRPLLVSTSSYSEADLREMLHHRELFKVAEGFGLVRHVARFLRHELGLPEMELYVRMDRAVRDAPERYPYLSWAFSTLSSISVPPGAWDLCYDDMHRYLVDELRVPASSALDTVLAVHVAVAPARDRSFPARFDLPHDYTAWFQAMVEAKELDLDWMSRTPRLSTFGPGVLEVDDPRDIVRRTLGRPLNMEFYGQWDLESPITRAPTIVTHV
jgi:hypothetical protein